MKKISTLFLALTALVMSSYGQCVPDSAGLGPNQPVYPNSLPCILQSSNYSGVLSFIVPDTLPGRDFGNPVVAFFTITIDSVQITSITGTPSGVSAASSPALGAWVPAGGYACMAFTGTTTAPLGNYPLTVSGVGCGHFTLPVIGTRVDSCMPFNFSSIYPYDLQVCDTQCTNTYDTTYANLCRGDSIQWGTFNVKRGGVYVDTVLQSIGCDSLKILIVTRLNPGIGLDSVSACGSVSYGGNTYSNDTTLSYVYPGASANGCDSIYRVRIYVGGLTPTITAGTTGLTAHDPNAGTYQWLLNGVPITGATSRTYTPVGGLNSYSVVVTDVYGCVDTSAVIMVSGINGIVVQDIKLYPNPNSGSFIMETHGSVGTAYTITNTLGQVILQNVISSDRQVIEMGNVATGVYTISVKGLDPIQFAVTK